MRTWVYSFFAFALALIMATGCTSDRQLEEEKRNDQPQIEDELEEGQEGIEREIEQQKLLRTRRQQEDNNYNDNNNRNAEKMVRKEQRQQLGELIEELEQMEDQEGAFRGPYVAQKEGENEYVFHHVDDVDDPILQERVEALIEFDSELAEEQIQVQVQEREVTLSGNVQNREHLARAVGLALGAQGVRSVRTQVEVNDEENGMEGQMENDQPQQQRQQRPIRRRRK